MTVPVDIASPIDPPIGARSVDDIVDIDLGTGRAFSDGVPHDAFDRLRAAGGIAWHDEAPIDPGFGDDSVLSFVPSPGFWVVTSHALVDRGAARPAGLLVAARRRVPAVAGRRTAWSCSAR